MGAVADGFADNVVVVIVVADALVVDTSTRMRVVDVVDDVVAVTEDWDACDAVADVVVIIFAVVVVVFANVVAIAIVIAVAGVAVVVAVFISSLWCLVARTTTNLAKQ